MRMPFSHKEPPSRLERARCAVRDRGSGAAQTVSGAAGAAQQAAASAAGLAQDAAQQVADRATVAAQQVAERARPLAAEVASRGGAAWQVIRHGAPKPSPMARVTSIVPLVTVTTAARRGRAPIALMALGAAGAVGLLWWRRQRAGADSVWILDTDSDVEPVGRWQEGESRAAADDAAMDDSRRSAGDRKESPANRWP